MVNGFDVVRPVSGVSGAELVAETVNAYTGIAREAGVAYTHQTMGYQTVNLGFGIEFILNDCGPGGWYASGLPDRANLIGNIMEYFGKTATLPGTEVEQNGELVTRLHRPHPNPFNPVTTLGYTVAAPAHVTLRVYDVNGRVVRTLIDAEHEPGAHAVQWDGRTDQNTPAASGVYFVRMESGGRKASHKEVRKLVLLK